MKLFTPSKELTQKHIHEIMVLTGCAMLLIVIAVFIGVYSKSGALFSAAGVTPGSQAADVFPCSWFSDCGSINTYYGMSLSPTTLIQGQTTQIFWESYNNNSGQVYSHCNADYPLGSYISDGYSGSYRNQDCWINPSTYTGIYSGSIQVGSRAASCGNGTS